MMRVIGQTSGVLFLLCGMALMMQAAQRLRADPPDGGIPTAICPNEDITTSTEDCAADNPCEIDNDEDSCLMTESHWEVKKFPAKCVTKLPDTQDRMCDKPNRLCKTYIECVAVED